MPPTRAWQAVLAILIAASSCDRTTSVGAVGPHRDAAADTAPTDGAAELCTSSGGTITTASCCANGAAAFPDTCAVGACGCSPAGSVTIMICNCPAGCFSPGVGCVAQAP